MWTYSDLNLIRLCNATARVFGRKDYRDDFAAVAKAAYFDAIGLDGWSIRTAVDGKSGLQDGVRFVISLEHMGRLGLLALAGGRWQDRVLVPGWFVRELETKRTRGAKANYDGPDDGKLSIDPKRYPEAPYGYMTWVNTVRRLLPGAGPGLGLGQRVRRYRRYVEPPQRPRLRRRHDQHGPVGREYPAHPGTEHHRPGPARHPGTTAVSAVRDGGPSAGVAAVAGVGEQLAEPGHHLRVGGVDVLRLAGVLRQVEQLVVVGGLLRARRPSPRRSCSAARPAAGPTRSTSFQSPARIA